MGHEGQVSPDFGRRRYGEPELPKRQKSKTPSRQIKSARNLLIVVQAQALKFFVALKDILHDDRPCGYRYGG